MAEYQLAQLNIARLRAPIDSPVLADFVAELDRINALAEASPGFVWRLQDESGDATALRPFGEELLINLSVWQDMQSLHGFVFRSDHAEIMRRRREWFERSLEAYLVLWWVPVGHQPDLAEAGDRLRIMRRRGPCPEAFSFRSAHSPPEQA